MHRSPSAMIRTRGFIPWGKIDAWLRAYRSIWISTTRPDGRPHSVPVWYVWDGQSIYFATQHTSQKARNLAHHPGIVVHTGDGDDALILEGVAEVVTDKEELTRLNAAYMEKYVDPHSGARATIPNEGDNVYCVRIRRIMVWEYGTIATRTDWVSEH